MTTTDPRARLIQSIEALIRTVESFHVVYLEAGKTKEQPLRGERFREVLAAIPKIISLYRQVDRDVETFASMAAKMGVPIFIPWPGPAIVTYLDAVESHALNETA